MADVVAEVDQVYAAEVKETEVELLATTLAADWLQSLAWNGTEYREFYQDLVDFFDTRNTEFQAAFASDPTVPLVARQIALTTVKLLDFASGTFLGSGCDGPEVRAQGMADNFSFLADEIFPGKKIIVWAHNTHVRHANSKTIGDGELGCFNMGEAVSEEYIDDHYSVGLYMYSGWAADNDRRPYLITAPGPSSLELFLYEGGEPLLFLDLLHLAPDNTPQWVNSPVYARAYGLYNVQMTPQDQYDGVLFFREVTPPTYVN